MNNMLQSAGNAFGVGAGGILGTAAGFAAMLLVIFIALRVTGIVKSGQPVYYIGRLCKILIETPIKALLQPIILLAQKIPVAPRVVSWFSKVFSDESIEAWFDRRFEHAKYPILRGDREAVARWRWPEEKYPHLWMHIPPDLELPHAGILDGRMIDGTRPSDTFAPSFVDTVLVGQSFRRAVLAGLFWAFVGLLAWHPRLYLATPMDTAIADNNALSARMSAERRAPDGGGNLEYKTRGVQLQEDAWDLETMNAKIREQAEANRDVMEARRESIIGSTSGGILTSLLLGLVVFYGSFRGLVRDAAQDRVKPLMREVKAETVLWKYRIDSRDNFYDSYLEQVRKATGYDKDSPLIYLGTATGTMQFRGAMDAPARDQRVFYSLEDMSSGTLLNGATSTGKTSRVIIPIFRQLLQLRRQAIAEGDPLRLSFYCTDGKGVLWRELKGAVERAGQSADLRIIGCDTASGEYGVDILDGVDPQFVGDTIRSIMQQANSGSESGDPMWPTMAGTVLRHAAVLCQAWELTDDGDALMQATGERIYSLIMIYQVAMDIEFQSRAILAILDAFDDENQDQEILMCCGVPNIPLTDSIRYMQTKWLPMTPATKMGIEANITAACSGFLHPSLRACFTAGAAKKMMTIPEIYGTISLVNLSSIDYGQSGRVINIMLKELLFTHARKRDIENPRRGAYQKLAYIADEYHELITSCSTLSDEIFSSMCRSSGLFYFVACQSLASLDQAIGPVAARAFIGNMRHRICLRTEDTQTLDSLVDLAGECERSYIFADNHFESYDAMVREIGYDPIEAGPARLKEEPSHVQSVVVRAITLAHRASMPIRFNTWEESVEYDDRFIPRSAHASEEAVLSAMQTASHRQEDLGRELRKDGNHTKNLLQKTDLKLMGSGMAYVYIQRAGTWRQDLIRLDSRQ